MNWILITLMSMQNGFAKKEVAAVSYFKVGHCYKLMHLSRKGDKTDAFKEIRCK